MEFRHSVVKGPNMEEQFGPYTDINKTLSYNKNKLMTVTQARNQPGTPGGAKSFLRGAQIF